MLFCDNKTKKQKKVELGIFQEEHSNNKWALTASHQGANLKSKNGAFAL